MSNKIIYNGEEYNGSIVNDAGVGEFTSIDKKKNPTGSNSEIFNSYGGQYANVASGDYSHAEGNNTVASGDYGSHAEGQNSQATGISSHAEGTGCIASGYYSHAEGNGTRATGYQSHAEGSSTQATNEEAHAEGDNTIASGTTSHAEGANTQALGAKSHAEGEYCIAGKSGYTALGAHAEGNHTESYGVGSHSEGQYTSAQQSGAHAEGNYTVASGVASHAEGEHCIAQGAHAHAGGNYTQATGSNSFVFGDNTNDGGYNNCLVVGDHTTASSSQQVVIGAYNINDDYAALIIGNGTQDTWTQYYIYNGQRFKAYANRQEYALGDLIYYHYDNDSTWRQAGLDSYYIWSAKQAHTSSTSTGNPFRDFANHGYTQAGMIYWEPVEGVPTKEMVSHRANILNFDKLSNLIIGTNQTITKATDTVSNSAMFGGDNTLNGSSAYSFVEGQNNTISSGSSHSHAEGYNNTINSNSSYSHIENYHNTITNGSTYCHAEGRDNTITNSSSYAHIEGNGNTIQNGSSFGHIEGQSNSMTNGSAHAHIEGYNNSITLGDKSHVEGAGNTLTSSTFCHIEGNANTISDSSSYSHAEGDTNTITGHSSFSHAEGYNNTISSPSATSSSTTYSLYSHIEGMNNKIQDSEISHAEGKNNTIQGVSQQSHIEGGNNTIVGGCSQSHAEGLNNTISGGAAYSHIEGNNNVIDQGSAGSHAEGHNNSVTSGTHYAHVEGISNLAQGNGSHVSGIGNISSHPNPQMVIGRCNSVDWNAAFIIGNGTLDSSDYISDYSSSSTYAVGAKVIYNRKIYECNTAIETVEPWTSSHWTDTGDEGVNNYKVLTRSNAMTVSWDGVLNVIGANADVQINGTSIASGGDIANPNISDAYNNTTTYAVGDYCIYNNSLYKCSTAVTVAEDFDSTKWTATTIGAELLNIKSRLSTIETSLGGLSFAATSSTPATPSANTVYFVTPS